jgi:hypothetical protein
VFCARRGFARDPTFYTSYHTYIPITIPTLTLHRCNVNVGIVMGMYVWHDGTGQLLGSSRARPSGNVEIYQRFVSRVEGQVLMTIGWVSIVTDHN